MLRKKNRKTRGRANKHIIPYDVMLSAIVYDFVFAPADFRVVWDTELHIVADNDRLSAWL